MATVILVNLTNIGVYLYNMYEYNIRIRGLHGLKTEGPNPARTRDCLTQPDTRPERHS